MAFVRGVMAETTAAGSRLKVSRSLSTNTGRAPRRATHPAVAKNEYVLVTTSSPLPMPSAISTMMVAAKAGVLTSCRSPYRNSWARPTRRAEFASTGGGVGRGRALSARRIARAIVQRRRLEPIKTAAELAELVRRNVPRTPGRQR